MYRVVDKQRPRTPNRYKTMAHFFRDDGRGSEEVSAATKAAHGHNRCDNVGNHERHDKHFQSAGFQPLRKRFTEAFGHESGIKKRFVVAAISLADRWIGMVVGKAPAEDGLQCDDGPAAKAHG